MEARMSDEARQKRDRAKKRARDAMGATKMSRSEGSRESSSSAPQSREGSSRPEHAHTYGGPLPDWKADVARLKSLQEEIHQQFIDHVVERRGALQ